MANLRFQQNHFEFDWFLDTLKKENVRSYLEIGSQYGGSLLKVAEVLPVPSRVVSVDIGGLAFDDLEDSITLIREMGHDAHVIMGDSTDLKIVAHVRRFAPFDACLIDANHTTPYLRQDWANYGPMCRMVAFHDIGWKPKPGAAQIDVPEFWQSIKGNYRHAEITLNERKNGIGVLWR